MSDSIQDANGFPDIGHVMRAIQSETAIQAAILRRERIADPVVVLQLYQSFVASIDRVLNVVDRLHPLGDEGIDKDVEKLRILRAEHAQDAEKIIQTTEADAPAGRVPPLSFLRAMWSIFWTAFRYPSDTTVIDLATGRVIGNLSDAQGQAQDGPVVRHV